MPYDHIATLTEVLEINVAELDALDNGVGVDNWTSEEKTKYRTYLNNRIAEINAEIAKIREDRAKPFWKKLFRK